MSVKLLYFAWVREKTGIGQESIDLPDHIETVADLMVWLKSRGPEYETAFEQSDVIVLVGSNLCIAHPIMWQRVCRNPHQPEILVLDPRTTETAAAATQHLALKPKSDLELLYGLAHILIAEGWIDPEFIDTNIASAMGIIVVFIGVFFSLALWMLNRGVGLRN